LRPRDAAETVRFLADLDRLPIETDRSPARDVVLSLARRHGLAVYDALYLELAIRHSASLATLDKHLATAAQVAGVPVLG
jgi:predicted nucleic acid-binding protein